MLATWTTLGAFYLSAAIVFGYPTGSMSRFYAEWFAAGACSGVALGLLGRESRDRARLQYVMPAALVLEPFAVIAVQLADRFGGLCLGAPQITAWSPEIVGGAVALVLVRRMGSRRV